MVHYPHHSYIMAQAHHKLRFTESAGSSSSSSSRRTMDRSQLSYDFEYEYLFKLLICGDCSVGKTSVMNRFVSNKFRVAHIRTLGVDFMMKHAVVQGKKVQLKIWDTAGQEEFNSITEQYFRRAQGILLVYDITNQKSFDDLQMWTDKLKQRLDSKTPIVLLGNKVDLEDRRQINAIQGLSFAQTENMPFFETSCKTSVNITEAVHCLAERILLEVENPKPIPEPIPGDESETNSTVTPQSEVPTSADQSIELPQEPIPQTKDKKWCSC